ncbi:unnamed protein product [Thlaspi arvense]|uniref:F-box domain-containing protein n=1 Tax=Thlaspi arvense TaxID=13288 RepID=A0AAU9RUW2_THLAR|nr:unnamed protein product [Thlaspi arvense]
MEMSSKTRAEEPSTDPPPVIPELPEDIIVDILARAPRCYYPTLSLVSKYIKSLVSSTEIYSRQSSLGCTEHCLYVVLYDIDNSVNRCYILRRKANGNSRLVLVPSLSSLPCGKRFVVLGSRIYVVGRMKNYCTLIAKSNVLTIDCRSHTVQHLPGVRIPYTANENLADIIDGRIYIVGYFDLKKVMVRLVVMAGKIYMRNSKNSFVYEPGEGIWKMDEKLSLEMWKDACVVDEVLYYYNWVKRSIRTYDPNERCWGVLKGMEEFLQERSGWLEIEMVSYGGRLGLVFLEGEEKSRKIWCAEVSLERRQGGEIWGKVEWCDHVLTGNFSIMKPLDVMV